MHQSKANGVEFIAQGTKTFYRVKTTLQYKAGSSEFIITGNSPCGVCTESVDHQKHRA